VSIGASRYTNTMKRNYESDQTCKDCVFWAKTDDPLDPNQGICGCEKLAQQTHPEGTKDYLVVWADYAYDAGFTTGEDFGCIHWKAHRSPELEAMLKDDVSEFNLFRQENPDVEINFDGCDFSGYCLRDVDLSGASLVETLFIHANLRRANFSSAKLEGTVFIGSDLTNARFTKARFKEVDLRFADVTGARIGD